MAPPRKAICPASLPWCRSDGNGPFGARGRLIVVPFESLAVFEVSAPGKSMKRLSSVWFSLMRTSTYLILGSLVDAADVDDASLPSAEAQPARIQGSGARTPPTPRPRSPDLARRGVIPCERPDRGERSVRLVFHFGSPPCRSVWVRDAPGEREVARDGRLSLLPRGRSAFLQRPRPTTAPAASAPRTTRSPCAHSPSLPPRSHRPL